MSLTMLRLRLAVIIAALPYRLYLEARRIETYQNTAIR